jgi:hypothetical protein
MTDMKRPLPVAISGKERAMHSAKNRGESEPRPLSDREIHGVSGGMPMEWFYTEVGGGYCSVGVHDYGAQMSYNLRIEQCPDPGFRRPPGW